MKNIRTSATVAVFAGLCVAIGVFAAFNHYIIPLTRGLPHKWLLLESYLVLCPLFGGAVAGLLYGRNEHTFVRAGVAVGALTGFVCFAALLMVNTLFWSSNPTHGMFILFFRSVMTDGVVAILAGTTGGGIGSTLRRVATRSNLGGGDGDGERPLIRDLAPVFLFTSIISFAFWGKMWLSIPPEIPNGMWGVTIGMTQDEVQRSKGVPNNTSDAGVWQYREKYQKNDTKDVTYLVSFQVGKVAQISVSRESRYPVKWGKVGTGYFERHLEEAIGRPTYILTSPDSSKMIWVYEKLNAFFVFSLHNPEMPQLGNSIESMTLYDPRLVKPGFAHY